MPKRQTVAGLGVPTILSLGAGVILYFVLTAMFPQLSLFVRGSAGTR